MTPWRIVCDIGGTNVRLARSDANREIADTVLLTTERCTSVTQTLRAYADRFSDSRDLEGIAVAAAGPVDDGRIQLTNCPLSVAVADIRSAFSNKPVRLMNDLEAVAWSLPWLRPEQLVPIRSTAAPLSGPRLVVNVGTGFGGALLVQTGKTWHSIACEPGHMKLAGTLPTESCMPLAPASVEDVISGLALARAQVAEMLGADAQAQPLASERPAAAFWDQQFNAKFSALLGQVCGDLVLACGAWGGVAFCGSVALAWLRRPDLQAFLSTFEAKGPMTPRMARVGISQILEPHPALIGLAAIPLE